VRNVTEDSKPTAVATSSTRSTVVTGAVVVKDAYEDRIDASSKRSNSGEPPTRSASPDLDGTRDDAEVSLPLDGSDQGGLALLLAKRLNGSLPDAQAVAQTTARDVRPRGMHGGPTSPQRIGRVTAQIDERKGSGCRVGEDVEVELERSIHVQGIRGELRDEVLPADPRQVRADASDQRRLENAQPEKIGEAGAFASASEIEQVPRVLPMGVVEGVVRMLLILERSDAGALESRGEAELPDERALDVAREGPRGGSVRRERRMKVVIGGAERQESARLPLLQHHPRNDAPGRLRAGDRPVVLEPDRHVKSDGLACQAAIGRGTIETIMGSSIADAISAR